MKDGFEILQHQRAEDVAGYRILYDARGMTGQPPIADMRMFMNQEQPGSSEQPRGPIAVIVSDPVLYNTSCIYAAMGKMKFSMSVFRDAVEVDEWLRSGEPHSRTR